MTEPLQVGQFAIVDHEPVDRGPNAGVFHGKGPADDRAELYIVAEGTTPAGEAFAGHVVSAVGQAFATLDMSLTGALRRLFTEAERNLRDWNRKSIAQHRVSIGLTCFGRRGDQAVIAQAGPSVAFHLSGSEVHAYFTDEEHGSPIGAGAAVEPQLTRIIFAPGDRLLMVSTAALRELDDEIISGIVSLPGQQVLQDLYRRLNHLRHLTAVLVVNQHQTSEPPATGDHEPIIDATGGGPALGAPTGQLAAATDAEVYQPSLFIEDDSQQALLSARMQLQEVNLRNLEAVVPALLSEIPQPLRRASGDNPLARLAAERQASVATTTTAVFPRTAASNGGGRPAWRSAPPGMPGVSSTSESRQPSTRRGSFSRGLVREDAPPRPAPNLQDVPLVDEMAAEYRAHTALLTPASETIAGESASMLNSGGSLVRVRGNMGGRWKGGGSLSRRPTAAAQLPPTWLVIAVGLGILLTLVGLVTVPRILDERSSQRYAGLVDNAQQKLATARVQQDPSEKRKALTEAQALLLEAKSLPDAGPEAAQLTAEVANALAVMDAVKSPAAVEKIASLEQFGDKPVAITRLTIGTDAAYILDNASRQVIAVTLATGDRKVIFGEDKEGKRGRPVATAFLEASDFGPALLIVDSTNALYAYTAAEGLRQLPFAAPSGLTINDIATNGRDLYVLDAAQTVVYRFAQAEAGFNQAPAKAITSPDLAAARRIMVDGEIVTADANGTLHRFTGQLALVLSEAGIDRRLLAAEAAQPLTKNGDLAVLDAPNDRIVVLKRDGAFDRQYRHKDFASLSAFAVRNGTAYVFSGGVLRRVTW